MDRLQDHFIVVGLGRLGKEVALEMFHSGVKVVAIDPKEQVIEDLPGAMVRLTGDGSSDDILAEANISRARGIAVATGTSATNVFVTLSARQLNPELHILTRVDDEESGRKALRAGADEIISPFEVSGARMAQGLLRPHAANFVDLAIGRSFGEFALEDIAIGDAPEYHGRLADLEIPKRHDILVIAVRKATGELLTGVGPKTEIQDGDVAVVMGRPVDIGIFARAAEGSGKAHRAPARRIGQ